MRFEDKFGHCILGSHHKSGEYKSLATWCNNMRTAYYDKIQRENIHIKLSNENTQRLIIKDIGFNFKRSQLRKKK